jgi:hypothetical protein
VAGTDATLVMTGSGTVGGIATWRVSESATPVDISDLSGGVGAVPLTAKANDDSKFIIRNNATFTHESLGDIEGVVENVNVSSPQVSFTIAPTLSLLNVERVSPPTGSQPLSEIFATYVALVTDAITVDYQATTDPTRLYGGWSSNVWTAIKELCAANRVEAVPSGTTLVVRDLGSTEFTIDDSQTVDISLSTDATGRAIDIVYQNYTLVSSTSLVYNYSQNPSVETNATGWAATKGTYGTITSGRVT